MKMSAKRYAIVRATSASSFETQLNETLDYLIEQNPTVTFSETGDYMIARIEYTAKVDVPEEPISEKGVKFSCEDCPYFEPETKTDGSEDKRKKYGGCPFTKYNLTFKTSAACEVLYNAIENGEVSLCFTK